MRSLKVLAVVMAFVLVGLGISPVAKAATYDAKVMVTFSQPVEIPGGMILAAGKYAFTVADHNAYRHVIRIFNEDKTKLFATVLAIPNYRLTPTDTVVITFAERPVTSPQAVKAWFYPGEKFGHEFVYPKARAVELAKVTNEPIPAITSEATAEPAESPREVERLERAPIAAEQPSGEEVQIAEAFPSQSLPTTGSMVPLIGLIGVLSLGMAFGIRIYAKQGA